MWFWFSILWVWCWSRDGWLYRTECFTGILSQCSSSTSCLAFHLHVLFDSWLQSRMSPSSLLSLSVLPDGEPEDWKTLSSTRGQNLRWTWPSATGPAQRVRYVSNIVLGKDASFVCSRFLPRSVYSETCAHQSQRAGTAQTHKLADFTIVWIQWGHEM